MITNFWNAHVREYDEHAMSRLHVGPMAPVWTSVWTAVLPAPPADILEVGAGTGQMTALLGAAGYRVTATDLAEGMLEAGRRRCAHLGGRVRFETGDAVRPAFGPESFDAVVSRYLLWTLLDARQAVAAWVRLVRPGGVVMIVDGAWFDAEIPVTGDSPYDSRLVERLSFARWRGVDEIVALLRGCGLSAVRADPLDEVTRWERAELPPADTAPQFRIWGRRPPGRP
ncbi:hypothetical protein BJF78_13535 [Pseudonocardia sp. CNS-139]|nr:hypothetical protein BJF78_13535 [Pseudonocardia sp. CNS-139]